MPTRILIVYRYPLLFQALKALMEGEGFRVMGHEDSPEAVCFAQQFQPDIVIVDFELPGGGLDSIRQILEVSPSTRIIVLSKHSEQYRVREALELGIRGLRRRFQLAPAQVEQHRLRFVDEAGEIPIARCLTGLAAEALQLRVDFDDDVVEP